MSAQQQRRELAGKLFREGLYELMRIGLVKHAPELFRYKLHIRTGWTDGARGGCSKDLDPGVYIGLRGDEFDKALTLRRRTEQPGRKGVWKLATQHAKIGEWLFVEYSHIHNDSVIGGFISDDPRDHTRALVAHELAHAVHWWHIQTGYESERTSHGKAWQAIYRELRVEWVNPLRAK